MDIRSFECFLVAAEELNFTRAAERLHLSQQSLSYQIQKLEHAYHTSLFDRTPNLRLTLAGQELIFYAKQMLNLDAQIRADFADISAFCRGHIRLGIARLRSSSVFPEIYADYHKRWQNIDFTLVEGTSEDFAIMLENQSLDAYIGFHPINMQGFESIAIGEDCLVCCMNRDFYQKYVHALFPPDIPADGEKKAISLHDISRFPLCIFPENNTLRIAIDQYFLQHRIKPNIVFECAAQNTTLQICSDNPVLGILTSTAYYYYTHTRSVPSVNDNIVAFPLKEPSTTLRLFLVYRTSSPTPKYLQDFITTASTAFQNYSIATQEALRHSIP